MSESLVYDVVVSVKTRYLAEQSEPKKSRYVFAYHITIANRGQVPARLLRRHWFITDAEGQIEEVEGEGVVGQKPWISPGDAYEYTSGCVLKTDCGTMQGRYRMRAEDGTTFDAEIEPFALRRPGVLH